MKPLRLGFLIVTELLILLIISPVVLTIWFLLAADDFVRKSKTKSS